MKKLIFVLLISLLTSVFVSAQTGANPKKSVFRANKDQIIMAQKMLKVTDTGKIDVATRDALKKFQSEKGIAATGAINRQTLEKLGIGLTTAQRETPVAPESAEASKPAPKETTAAKTIMFRATKIQIKQAQKILKENDFYAGAANGALDAATRAGLKKYQAANELTASGMLDAETLEKMGIELTDTQKTDSIRKSQ